MLGLFQQNRPISRHLCVPSELQSTVTDPSFEACYRSQPSAREVSTEPCLQILRVSAFISSQREPYGLAGGPRAEITGPALDKRSGGATRQVKMSGSSPADNSDWNVLVTHVDPSTEVPVPLPAASSAGDSAQARNS